MSCLELDNANAVKIGAKVEMSRMRSPNELLKAATVEMLDGREPETYQDWVKVMNFFACNVDADCAQVACSLLAKLYSMPIVDSDIEAIVNFQLAQRA